jgi:hypothetical protein
MPRPRLTMNCHDATPAGPDDEAARLIQEALQAIALPLGQREALLRRILQRTGGQPPLAPAPPPKTD